MRWERARAGIATSGNNATTPRRDPMSSLPPTWSDHTPTPGAPMRCDYHERQLGDHEVRLRTLERAYWRIVGIGAAVSGIAAFGGALATRLFAK